MVLTAVTNSLRQLVHIEISLVTQVRYSCFCNSQDTDKSFEGSCLACVAVPGEQLGYMEGQQDRAFHETTQYFPGF